MTPWPLLLFRNPLLPRLCRSLHSPLPLRRSLRPWWKLPVLLPSQHKHQLLPHRLQQNQLPNLRQSLHHRRRRKNLAVRRSRTALLHLTSLPRLRLHHSNPEV